MIHNTNNNTLGVGDIPVLVTILYLYLVNDIISVFLINWYIEIFSILVVKIKRVMPIFNHVLLLV